LLLTSAGDVFAKNLVRAHAILGIVKAKKVKYDCFGSSD
jgi:hypothetical protein